MIIRQSKTCGKVALLALSALFTLASCKNDMFFGKKPDIQRNFGSDFSRIPGARLCGNFMSIVSGDPKKDNGLLEGNLQLGVCGSVPNSKNEWKAIGMSAESSTVYVRSKSDPNVELRPENTARLVIKGQNEVYAVLSNNQEIKVGSAPSAVRGAIIKPEAGIEFELRIRGVLYDLSIPKNVANEDKAIWILTP